MSTSARFATPRRSKGARTFNPLRLRTLLVAASVVAVTVAGSVGLSRLFAASSPASVLGVYAGSENVAGVRQFGQAVGVQPANAMDFLDGSSWSSIIASAASFPRAWGSGYQMTWGVDMLPNSGASLASEAAGAYDANFVQVADNLVAAGQGNAIIRLGWEMNGSWFPWGTNAGSAADFVGAYQHVVSAMRSAPGQSFRFEWNPTLGGGANLASYYPGDGYVDIIAMDVYDQTVNAYPGPAAAWQGYLSGAAGASTYGLNWLAGFAASHGKQIAFPEWGLGYNTNNGGDDPTFVDDMAQWISTHNVVNALFWDYGDWVGTGQNPNTVAALTSSFGPAASAPRTATANLNAPVVGIAPTRDGGGYWEVASDGGLFAFGDAAYYGSMGGQHLNQPIVGIAATPSGHGYWEVASDGGLFSFGDAGFYGSMGGRVLNEPVVATAAS